MKNECNSLNMKLSMCDTDGIKVCFDDMRFISVEDRKEIGRQLNAIMPEMIYFEDDGYFNTVVIIKSKNYIIDDGKSVKFKGSSLVDQKKEPALKEMIKKIGHSLLNGYNESEILSIYSQYISEARNPSDIKRWAKKVTITKAVLDCASNPEARLNERKVYDAIKNTDFQENDKVYLYDASAGEIQDTKDGQPLFIKKTGLPKMKKHVIMKKIENYSGDHVPEKLLKRVYDTLKIFETVIELEKFNKFKE